MSNKKPRARVVWFVVCVIGDVDIAVTDVVVVEKSIVTSYVMSFIIILLKNF